MSFAWGITAVLFKTGQWITTPTAKAESAPTPRIQAEPKQYPDWRPHFVDHYGNYPETGKPYDPSHDDY